MTYASVITQNREIHKSCKRKKRPWTIRKKKAIEKNKFYDVENILAKRSIGNGTEYFVSWHGFGTKDNGWISKLPAFFEDEWGASTNKPFMEDNVFEKIVDLACLILSGYSETDVMKK